MNTYNHHYTTPQLTALIFCRVAIGWHFLYEGCVKLMNPQWSARGFLLDSQGPLDTFFFWIANNQTVLQSVDLINQWGLVLIGLGLMMGLLSRGATLAGIAMLALFYLSHPPFIGAEYMMPSEGSYWIVNKNLIELTALLVIYLFPTSRIIGLDRIIVIKSEKSKSRG